MLEALLSKNSNDKIEAMRKSLGISADVPEEIARRLEMLTIGSVEPKLTLDIAVKLSETFPIEFYQLTTKISELTGKGHVPGKPKPSGETTRSEQ